MKQTPIRRTHITHIIIVIAFQFPINNSAGRAKCDLLTRISGGELAGAQVESTFASTEIYVDVLQSAV